MWMDPLSFIIHSAVHRDYSALTPRRGGIPCQGIISSISSSSITITTTGSSMSITIIIVSAGTVVVTVVDNTYDYFRAVLSW